MGKSSQEMHPNLDAFFTLGRIIRPASGTDHLLSVPNILED